MDIPEFPFDPMPRLVEYVLSRDRMLLDKLGSGFDGIVWSTNCRSAVKCFRRRELYENERNVYLRLLERQVQQIVGFNVPQLLGYDDRLLAIEMEIVSPPFVVDFAGAYLDCKPPFDEEQMAEWLSDRADVFESDWPQVKRLWYAFQKYGIVLNDLKPGNVMCR